MFESEEEPRRVNNILGKLIALRTKTTDTRRMSNASLEPDQLYEREDKYLSNIRTGTEDDVICRSTEIDSTGSVHKFPSGTTHKSNGSPVATSAVQDLRRTLNIKK